MKNIGIIRKIDELGRIVLPKELRKTLSINSGDDFQITIDNEKIILEKYSRLENYEDKILEIINCFSIFLNYDIFFIVNNKIINYNHEEISNVISNIILDRKLFYIDKIGKNIINDSLMKEGRIVIMPVVYNSDLLGSIIIISNDSIKNLINCAKIIDNLVKKILLSK